MRYSSITLVTWEVTFNGVTNSIISPIILKLGFAPPKQKQKRTGGLPRLGIKLKPFGYKILWRISGYRIRHTSGHIKLKNKQKVYLEFKDIN